MNISLLNVGLLVAATLILALLNGCGPGTGGTGTGPILNAPSTNASVGLSATSPPISNDTAIGTWSTADANTIVIIAADKIFVISNCIQFTFVDTWMIDANQRIARQGDALSLVVTFANQQLSFSVRNSRGETITSGTGLNKTSSETIAPAIQCPNL